MTIQDFIDAALAYQGAPYVWCGKGHQLWSTVGLVSHSWHFPVFDCSGLVGTAIRDAGGPDWRATRSAETYRKECAPSLDPWAFGALRLYGRNGKADHIAIVLAQGYVLEAAGGDSSTRTPADAAKRRHACVRVNRDRRADFMCAVALPF